MKAIKKLILMILLLAVFAIGAQAASLEVTNVNFEGKPNEEVTAHFEVTYNGKTICELTGIGHTLNSQFKTQLPANLIGTQLKKGDKKLFSMKIKIPDNYTSGNYKLGRLAITATEFKGLKIHTLQANSDINLNVINTNNGNNNGNNNGSNNGGNTDLPNSPYLTVSDITFTGDKGNTVTGTFTIKNNAKSGSDNPITFTITFTDIKLKKFNITNIQASSDLGSNYNAVFSNVPTKLLPGETKTITMQITIPDTLSTGMHNEIGHILVEGLIEKPNSNTGGGSPVTTSIVTSVIPTTIKSTGKINIQVTNTPPVVDFTVSSATLGGATQERGQYDTATITIKNTGNTELTNLQFSSTADSAYDVTFENKPTRLAPGDQATVTVKGKIPLNFDSGTRKIGTISVAANSKTVTSDLNMQAPSKLEIKKVRINCNEDTSTVRDGKTIDNVAPGSTCSLSITVSNTYDRNSGIDFEDIEIEADGDQEIDGDKETIDLDAGEEETITIDLEIDDDADKGEYDAFVRVEGQDSNSANHYAELEFKIKIEKPEHEIEIKSINLNPLSVDTCLVSEVTAEIRLYNNGENKEKNAGVEVRVPGLSFTKVIKDLVIDEGEDFVVKVPITIPKNAYPGKYNVIVTSLYEDVLPSKTSTAVFTILDECASQVTTLPPTTSNEENQEAEATETIKEKRTDLKNALFNMMLFFANIIVATTLVILGVKLYKDIKGMKK